MKNTNSLTWFFTLSSSLLVLSLLSSCGINTRTSYVVNPDLSCKCVYEQKAGLDVAVMYTYFGGSFMNSKDLSGLSALSGTDSVTPTPQEVLLGFANKILSNKSVEAWKDIDFHMIGTDTVYFKGTAFIKNLANGGLSTIDTGMRIFNNDMGQTVIEMKEYKKTKDSSSKDYTSSIYKSLFKGGLYSSMMHYYMAMFLRDYNMSVTYQLPGKIVSTSNFVKKNDNTAELSINGKNMIHYLDTMMRNTDLISKMYSNSSSINPYAGNSDYAIYKYLFGEAAPVRVVYETTTKPQFDYAKEVAEAKKYYAAFLIKSGIAAYDSIAIVKKQLEEAEKKKEEGTLVLTANDSANDKMYFKTLTATQYYRGNFSLTGELSKPVNSVSFATVSLTSLITDNGISMLDSIPNPTSISAYISTSSTNYLDSVQYDNKVTFSIFGNFPDDCKYVNLKGMLNVDSVTTVPFTIINLNLIKSTSAFDGKNGTKY